MGDPLVMEAGRDQGRVQTVAKRCRQRERRSSMPAVYAFETIIRLSLYSLAIGLALDSRGRVLVPYCWSYLDCSHCRGLAGRRPID